MNCQKCNEPVEDGAAFCGNCGQSLAAPALSEVPNIAPTPIPNSQPPIQQPVLTPQPPVQQNPITANVTPPPSVSAKPAYAIANPASHRGDVKALLSLLFGIIGLVGCLFMAVLGLAFGVAGLVMGTMSRKSRRKILSTIGIVLSILSILASIATVVYYVGDKSEKDNKKESTTSSSKSVVEVGSELSTPCYSLGLVDRLNIDNGVGSCDMKAYDGDKFEDSTIAYKVYANKSEVTTEAGFYKIAKSGIDKDVATNLKGYKVDSQQSTKFAGSPAYVVKATSPAGNVTVAEAAVFHESKNGNNIFVIVVAKVDGRADMQIIESQWVWKK